MGALRLRLSPGQTVYGRLGERDFELTNLQGTLCLAFARTANVYPLPECGMIYGFDGLDIKPQRRQRDGLVRFSTMGAPVLHEAHYMHPADAENAIDDLYVCIQEYWLNGDYDELTKDWLLDELEERLEELEDMYPEEQRLVFDAIFDFVQDDQIIAALIEIQDLSDRVETSGAVPSHTPRPDQDFS